MRYPMFLMVFSALVMLTGLSNAENENDYSSVIPYGHETHFMSDPEPEPLEVFGNPLDYASAKLGFDIRNFELPKGYEGRYRFACRYPIIDYVSNDPMFMKQWTEDVSSEITETHKENALNAAWLALSTLRGVNSVGDHSLMSGIFPETDGLFENALRNMNYTKRYRDILIVLYKNLLVADNIALEAKQHLSEEDLKFFNDNPGYFITPDGKRMPSVTGSVDTHFNFIERARKVDYERIFTSARIIFDALNEYIESTKGFKQQDYFNEGADTKLTFEFDSPFGKIVIGGFDDDTHYEDAALIIDLGGDDKYTNNAGGCVDIKYNLAICIDHSGNDVYSSKERNYIQGFGFIGTGVLIDLDGYDIYEANHYSQGAGIMGVGVLWDKNGDDKYIANAFCQGAGMFGLGIILDDNGEDFYDCATLGQAGATTLGLGVLSDLAGDDRYHLNIGPGKDNLGSAGYGQGGALSFRHFPWLKKLTAYGGVGLLIDNEGNDRYRTSGWCDQGGSYIMSLGALVDNAGNDHYTSNTGTGQGIHITNAIVIDKGGDDIYEGGFRSGAGAGDRTPAFLIDYDGDDTYIAKRGCFGNSCKPYGLAILVDYKGDDKYIAPNPEGPVTFNNWDSVGGVWPESVGYLWPYAIMLDLGGKDDYQIRNRKNNSQRHSFGHGLHIDMEYDGGDVFGVTPNPLPEYTDFALPDTVLDSKYYSLIKSLQDPDLFRRFWAVGVIVNSSTDIVQYLVDTLLVTDHKQFNRDVMECIDYFLTNEKLSDSEMLDLIRLLDAKDPEVRTLIADDFGIWMVQGAVDALINSAQSDPEESVRRFAMASLVNLETDKALPVARKLAVHDPSLHVRRIAVYYISQFSQNPDDYLLFEKTLKNDPDHSVKVAAAEAIGYIQDERGIEPLKEAAKSYDAYLQRAAGKALAELYQIEGVEILIESLTFPSIDAFYNYARNVPNHIASYTGHDFVDDDRYEQDKWREWFKENKDKIDLKKHVDSFRAFNKVEKKSRNLDVNDQIAVYEDFLKEFPDFEKAKIDLASKLNSLAWNMVTAAPDSQDYNPELGLKFAIRAVELQDEPNIIDTLAEAYFVNGMYDECMKLCQEMIDANRSPGMFTERLDRCKQALKK